MHDCKYERIFNMMNDDLKEIKSDVKMLLEYKNQKDGVSKVLSKTTVIMSTVLSALVSVFIKLFDKF